MKFDLPKDLAESLPAPDDEGLVRVTAALKLGADGKAEIVSLNDKPLPTESDDSSPAANLPKPSEMDLGDGSDGY